MRNYIFSAQVEKNIVQHLRHTNLHSLNKREKKKALRKEEIKIFI